MSAGPEEEAATPTKRANLVTVGITMGAMVIILDTSIITVALPHMQGGLSASQDQISWVVTVYLIVLAVMTPPTGWFARHFGRKKLYLTSLAIFAGASMACGLAQSLETVIALRMLQAGAGAFLVPLTQAALLDIHPKHRHAKAISWWAFGMTFGPFLGPTLGGYVVEEFGWREAFFIATPFCVVAFLLILFLLPEKRDTSHPRFSFTGFFLLSLGLGGLQLMLDRGERDAWFSSNLIMGAGLAAVIGLTAFVVHSSVSREPFFQPQLVRDRNFLASATLFYILGMIQFTTLTLMPSFMQDVLGYSAFLTGLVLAPRALGAMMGNAICAQIVQRVDKRLVAGLGFSSIAFSYYELTQITADITPWSIVLAMVMQGLGMPLVFVTLTNIGFATLTNDLRPDAAAVFNLTRGVGGSMGVAVMITLLTRNTQINHSVMVEQITPFNDILSGPGNPALWDPSVLEGLAALDALVNHQALQIAYLNNFWLMLITILATLPLLLLLGGSRQQTKLPEQAT